MRSIEVHLIETASDVDTAIRNGLVADPAELDHVECAACSDVVGLVDGVFYEFALLLDERDECWFICYPCIEDVVDPRAATDSSFEDLYVDDDEFDTFDLTDDE